MIPFDLMSLSNTSVIKVIDQYITQYIKQIDELKVANASLKKQLEQNVSEEKYLKLKKQFDDLSTRLNEIKQAFTEAEQENTMLRKQNIELRTEKESIVTDVEQYFKNSIGSQHVYPPQTPVKSQFSTPISQPPNQKVKHRDSKYQKINFQKYDSDDSDDSDDLDDLDDSDDSDDSDVLDVKPNSSRVLNFNSTSTKETNNLTSPSQSVQSTPNIVKLDIGNADEKKYDDEDEMSIEIMKKLLGEGLMNELEKTINEYSQPQTPVNSQNVSKPKPQADSNLFVPRFVFGSNAIPNEQNQRRTQVNQSQSKKARNHSQCGISHNFRPDRISPVNYPVQTNQNSQSNNFGSQDTSEVQLFNLLINSLINPRSK